ncbi:MAG: glycosyltransferase [Chloroflexota bacterium]|nr:glycosyltransferase [Chloroflexota bacterium]
MRVLFYHPRAAIGDGGITNAVRKLSAAMARSGTATTIACEGAVPDSPSSGVRWEAIQHDGRGLLRRPSGLGSLLREHDVVILHSGWSGHNVYAARGARAVGVPYVLAPRGAYNPRILRRKRVVKMMWFAAFERGLLAHARATHVFFESERADLAALGYLGSLLIAPNGVEPPANVRWDGGSGGYVLWLGRFDAEHKGLDLLLQALALIPAEERPPLRLHGPDWRGQKRKMRVMVSALDLDRHVTIGEPAYGQAKWELMRSAIGFAYPSRWEAFGNAPAEAASIGVPTLMTPYPLGRYLASGGGAVLADATAESLSRGLRTLTSKDAAEVGRAGARVLASEMTWAQSAASWRTRLDALL